MEVLTRVADASLVETGLIDCLARARAFDGDTLIATSDSPLSTAWPEANGSLLVPEADVDMGKLREIGQDQSGQITFAGPSGNPVAWRDERKNSSGQALIGLDRKALNIVLEDRRPGSENGVSTQDRFPRWGDIIDLAHLMNPAPLGGDVFEAPPFGTVRRNVVEGGQLLGATIVAASRVDPDKHVVSAHSIFSRPAVFDSPLRFEIGRSRMGRSFSTLTAEVTQGGKPISTGLLLLDSGADDLNRHHAPMPDVPGPQDAPVHDFGLIGRELRIVDGAYDPDPGRVSPPFIHAWMRHRWQPVDPALRQAILAQPTTHWTIAASMLPHKGYGEVMAHRTISTGVLSSTMFFHGDPDLTGWLLYTTQATHAGNGLAQGEGRIYTQAGELVGTYSVQVMVRGLIGAESGMKDDRLM